MSSGFVLVVLDHRFKNEGNPWAHAKEFVTLPHSSVGTLFGPMDTTKGFAFIGEFTALVAGLIGRGKKKPIVNGAGH